MDSIHESPRRVILGNPYIESCIAPVRYVYPLSQRTRATGDVGQKGPAVKVSKIGLPVYGLLGN